MKQGKSGGSVGTSSGRDCEKKNEFERRNQQNFAAAGGGEGGRGRQAPQANRDGEKRIGAAVNGMQHIPVFCPK